LEDRFCGFPIVTLDCQVNQVMVMKTQQDTSQNLASSNHNCDFPPNQKKTGQPCRAKEQPLDEGRRIQGPPVVSNC